MKSISFPVLMLVLITMVGCKKTRPLRPFIQKNAYEGFVSFRLDGETYIFEHRYGSAIGNKPIHIREQSWAAPGDKLAYQIAGRSWYGEKDFTAYLIRYNFDSAVVPGDLSISFSKHFKDTALESRPPLLVLEDHQQALKTGIYPFALDLEQANSMEGVFLELLSPEFAGRLVSGNPGRADFPLAEPDGGWQPDAYFGLNKVEALGDGLFLIEANFQMRLYDASGKVHELKEGYLRTTTRMKLAGNVGLF